MQRNFPSKLVGSERHHEQNSLRMDRSVASIYGIPMSMSNRSPVRKETSNFFEGDENVPRRTGQHQLRESSSSTTQTYGEITKILQSKGSPANESNAFAASSSYSVEDPLSRSHLGSSHMTTTHSFSAKSGISTSFPPSRSALSSSDPSATFRTPSGSHTPGNRLSLSSLLQTAGGHDQTSYKPSFLAQRQSEALFTSPTSSIMTPQNVRPSPTNTPRKNLTAIFTPDPMNTSGLSIMSLRSASADSDAIPTHATSTKFQGIGFNQRTDARTRTFSNTMPRHPQAASPQHAHSRRSSGGSSSGLSISELRGFESSGDEDSKPPRALDFSQVSSSHSDLNSLSSMEDGSLGFPASHPSATVASDSSTSPHVMQQDGKFSLTGIRLQRTSASLPTTRAFEVPPGEKSEANGSNRDEDQSRVLLRQKTVLTYSPKRRVKDMLIPAAVPRSQQSTPTKSSPTQRSPVQSGGAPNVASPYAGGRGNMSLLRNKGQERIQELRDRRERIKAIAQEQRTLARERAITQKQQALQNNHSPTKDSEPLSVTTPTPAHRVQKPLPQSISNIPRDNDSFQSVRVFESNSSSDSFELLSAQKSPSLAKRHTPAEIAEKIRSNPQLANPSNELHRLFSPSVRNALDEPIQAALSSSALPVRAKLRMEALRAKRLNQSSQSPNVSLNTMIKSSTYESKSFNGLASVANISASTVSSMGQRKSRQAQLLSFVDTSSEEESEDERSLASNIQSTSMQVDVPDQEEEHRQHLTVATRVMNLVAEVDSDASPEKTPFFERTARRTDSLLQSLTTSPGSSPVADSPQVATARSRFMLQEAHSDDETIANYQGDSSDGRPSRKRSHPSFVLRLLNEEDSASSPSQSSADQLSSMDVSEPLPKKQLSARILRKSMSDSLYFNLSSPSIASVTTVPNVSEGAKHKRILQFLNDSESDATQSPVNAGRASTFVPFSKMNISSESNVSSRHHNNRSTSCPSRIRRFLVCSTDSEITFLPASANASRIDEVSYSSFLHAEQNPSKRKVSGRSRPRSATAVSRKQLMQLLESSSDMETSMYDNRHPDMYKMSAVARLDERNVRFSAPHEVRNSRSKRISSDVNAKERPVREFIVKLPPKELYLRHVRLRRIAGVVSDESTILQDSTSSLVLDVIDKSFQFADATAHHQQSSVETVPNASRTVSPDVSQEYAKKELQKFLHERGMSSTEDDAAKLLRTSASIIQHGSFLEQSKHMNLENERLEQIDAKFQAQIDELKTLLSDLVTSNVTDREPAPAPAPVAADPIPMVDAQTNTQKSLVTGFEMPDLVPQLSINDKYSQFLNRPEYPNPTLPPLVLETKQEYAQAGTAEGAMDAFLQSIKDAIAVDVEKMKAYRNQELMTPSSSHGLKREAPALPFKSDISSSEQQGPDLLSRSDEMLLNLLKEVGGIPEVQSPPSRVPKQVYEEMYSPEGLRSRLHAKYNSAFPQSPQSETSPTSSASTLTLPRFDEFLEEVLFDGPEEYSLATATKRLIALGSENLKKFVSASGPTTNPTSAALDVDIAPGTKVSTANEAMEMDRDMKQSSSASAQGCFIFPAIESVPELPLYSNYFVPEDPLTSTLTDDERKTLQYLSDGQVNDPLMDNGVKMEGEDTMLSNTSNASASLDESQLISTDDIPIRNQPFASSHPPGHYIPRPDAPLDYTHPYYHPAAGFQSPFDPSVAPRLSPDELFSQFMTTLNALDKIDQAIITISGTETARNEAIMNHQVLEFATKLQEQRTLTHSLGSAIQQNAEKEGQVRDEAVEKLQQEFQSHAVEHGKIVQTMAVELSNALSALDAKTTEADAAMKSLEELKVAVQAKEPDELRNTPSMDKQFLHSLFSNMEKERTAFMDVLLEMKNVLSQRSTTDSQPVTKEAVTLSDISVLWKEHLHETITTVVRALVPTLSEASVIGHVKGQPSDPVTQCSVPASQGQLTSLRELNAKTSVTEATHNPAGLEASASDTATQVRVQEAAHASESAESNVSELSIADESEISEDREVFQKANSRPVRELPLDSPPPVVLATHGDGKYAYDFESFASSEYSDSFHSAEQQRQPQLVTRTEQSVSDDVSEDFVYDTDFSYMSPAQQRSIQPDTEIDSNDSYSHDMHVEDEPIVVLSTARQDFEEVSTDFDSANSVSATEYGDHASVETPRAPYASSHGKDGSENRALRNSTDASNTRARDTRRTPLGELSSNVASETSLTLATKPQYSTDLSSINLSADMPLDSTADLDNSIALSADYETLEKYSESMQYRLKQDLVLLRSRQEKLKVDTKRSLRAVDKKLDSLSAKIASAKEEKKRLQMHVDDNSVVVDSDVSDRLHLVDHQLLRYGRHVKQQEAVKQQLLIGYKADMAALSRRRATLKAQYYKDLFVFQKKQSRIRELQRQKVHKKGRESESINDTSRESELLIDAVSLTRSRKGRDRNSFDTSITLNSLGSGTALTDITHDSTISNPSDTLSSVHLGAHSLDTASVASSIPPLRTRRSQTRSQPRSRTSTLGRANGRDTSEILQSLQHPLVDTLIRGMISGLSSVLANSGETKLGRVPIEAIHTIPLPTPQTSRVRSESIDSVPTKTPQSAIAESHSSVIPTKRGPLETRYPRALTMQSSPALASPVLSLAPAPALLSPQSVVYDTEFESETYSATEATPHKGFMEEADGMQLLREDLSSATNVWLGPALEALDEEKLEPDSKPMDESSIAEKLSLVEKLPVEVDVDVEEDVEEEVVYDSEAFETESSEELEEQVPLVLSTSVQESVPASEKEEPAEPVLATAVVAPALALSIPAEEVLSLGRTLQTIERHQEAAPVGTLEDESVYADLEDEDIGEEAAEFVGAVPTLEEVTAAGIKNPLTVSPMEPSVEKVEFSLVDLQEAEVTVASQGSYQDVYSDSFDSYATDSFDSATSSSSETSMMKDDIAPTVASIEPVSIIEEFGAPVAVDEAVHTDVEVETDIDDLDDTLLPEEVMDEVDVTETEFVVDTSLYLETQMVEERSIELTSGPTEEIAATPATADPLEHVERDVLSTELIMAPMEVPEVLGVLEPPVQDTAAMEPFSLGSSDESVKPVLVEDVSESSKESVVLDIPTAPSVAEPLYDFTNPVSEAEVYSTDSSAHSLAIMEAQESVKSSVSESAETIESTLQVSPAPSALVKKIQDLSLGGDGDDIDIEALISNLEAHLDVTTTSDISTVHAPNLSATVDISSGQLFADSILTASDTVAGPIPHHILSHKDAFVVTLSGRSVPSELASISEKAAVQPTSAAAPESHVAEPPVAPQPAIVPKPASSILKVVEGVGAISLPGYGILFDLHSAKDVSVDNAVVKPEVVVSHPQLVAEELKSSISSSEEDIVIDGIAPAQLRADSYKESDVDWVTNDILSNIVTSVVDHELRSIHNVQEMLGSQKVEDAIASDEADVASMHGFLDTPGHYAGATAHLLKPQFVTHKADDRGLLEVARSITTSSFPRGTDSSASKTPILLGNTALSSFSLSSRYVDSPDGTTTSPVSATPVSPVRQAVDEVLAKPESFLVSPGIESIVSNGAPSHVGPSERVSPPSLTYSPTEASSPIAEAVVFGKPVSPAVAIEEIASLGALHTMPSVSPALVGGMPPDMLGSMEILKPTHLTPLGANAAQGMDTHIHSGDAALLDDDDDLYEFSMPILPIVPALPNQPGVPSLSPVPTGVQPNFHSAFAEHPIVLPPAVISPAEAYLSQMEMYFHQLMEFLFMPFLPGEYNLLNQKNSGFVFGRLLQADASRPPSPSVHPSVPKALQFYLMDDEELEAFESRFQGECPVGDMQYYESGGVPEKRDKPLLVEMRRHLYDLMNEYLYEVVRKNPMTSVQLVTLKQQVLETPVPDTETVDTLRRISNTLDEKYKQLVYSALKQSSEVLSNTINLYTSPFVVFREGSRIAREDILEEYIEADILDMIHEEEQYLSESVVDEITHDIFDEIVADNPKL